MSARVRTTVALVALVFARAAVAGDACYCIPIGDLKFTEGALPKGPIQPPRRIGPGWRMWPQWQAYARARPLRPK